jgi:hypothetical protein
MFGFLQRLVPGRSPEDAPSLSAPGSGVVSFDESAFDFSRHSRWHEGIPHPDWDAALAWQSRLPDSRHAQAWLALERGWLDWLRGAIGERYRLHESEVALLLTAQPERLARIKLGYLDTTLRRIERALEELADHDHVGKEILIAFDDAAEYTRYVAAFEPVGEAVGASAGMHIGTGCGHFVTHGQDLAQLEPTIVHEMTHSCLAHLSLPLWLNEGVAQAIERRFAGSYEDPHAALARARRQATFWTPRTIQEFWSGRAFQRPDDHQEMAYALALDLTQAFAGDWSRFKAFVLEASHADAGMAAARDRLDLDLGAYLGTLFGHPTGADWAPDPRRWKRHRQ